MEKHDGQENGRKIILVFIFQLFTIAILAGNGADSRALAVVACPVLTDLRLRNGTNQHAALQNAVFAGWQPSWRLASRAVSERIGANVKGE
jgi:hypothetical protein